jgi:hypothetical protein
VRVISPGQIAQAFEGAGGKFQDPALVPLMVTQYVQRSLSGRLLTVIQYAATAGAGVSAGIAGAKSTLPGLGSTKTWTYAAMGQAALGVAIPLAQKTLQGDVASQKATITAGVKAALIDMGDLPYTVPAGGCAAVAHRLFIGSGVTGAVKAVLP